MRTRSILGSFLLMLGIGSLGETQTKSEPAPEADAKRIGELIQKLGSAKDQDRSQAQKELEGLGTQALEQLQDAAKLGERAAEVARHIEGKIHSAKLLAPRRVRLKVADASLQEAVDEMAKISGYPIAVQAGPANLKDMKITLDTGDVTFWEALDQLCDKAGLTHQAFLPGMPGIIKPPQPLPVPIKPPVNIPADKLPVDGVLPPKPLDPKPLDPKLLDKDAPKKDAPPRKGLEGLKLEPNPAPPAPLPPVVAPPVPLQPGEVPPPIAQPPILGQPPPPLMPLGKPGQIVLRPRIEGAAKGMVSYAGAVRVQIAPMFGHRGEHQFMVSLTAEPRLQGLSLIGNPAVTTAEDDQGQKLVAAANPMGVGPIGVASPMFPGGMSMTLLRLKAGEKEAKGLKELTGTLSAQVMGPAGTLARVDNVLKAAGESVKGKRGGSLKVIGIEKTEDGEFKVHCQIVNPAPEIGIGAPIMAAPGMTQNVPDLLDAKGNAFKVLRTLGQKFVPADGGGLAQELTILYAQKDQGNPESLVLQDMRRLTIAVPFSFQNVPLSAAAPAIKPPVPPVPPAPLPPAQN